MEQRTAEKTELKSEIKNILLDMECLCKHDYCDNHGVFSHRGSRVIITETSRKH